MTDGINFETANTPTAYAFYWSVSWSDSFSDQVNNIVATCTKMMGGIAPEVLSMVVKRSFMAVDTDSAGLSAVNPPLYFFNADLSSGTVRKHCRQAFM